MAQTDDASGSTTAQIARLRAQVEELMKDRVTPAVAGLADRAEAAMTGARDVVRDQAETVSSRVRDQPLVAILVAAGVGWIIGRLMR